MESRERIFAVFTRAVSTVSSMVADRHVCVCVLVACILGPQPRPFIANAWTGLLKLPQAIVAATRGRSAEPRMNIFRVLQCRVRQSIDDWW